MAMQLLRGALFLMAVVSILFPWRRSHRGLGDDLHPGYRARLPADLSGLPAGLRIPHNLEWLADSLLQAGVCALLLCYPLKMSGNLAPDKT
jgi:hypothetical protein